MHLVTYDIADTRERNGAIRLIEQYGIRVERGVWLCDLYGSRRDRLLDSLKTLNIESGFIDVWNLSADCRRIGSGDAIPSLPACHVV